MRRLGWWTLLVVVGCDPGGGGFQETTPPAATSTPSEPCMDAAFEVVDHFDGDTVVDPDGPMDSAMELSGPGVALVDLDGDGDLDAVMAVPLQGSRVFTNDGAGGMTRDDRYTLLDGALLPFAAGVAAADVDADGDVDLVLARGTGVDDLVLYRRDATRFEAVPLAESTANSLTPSVGDLDGDGDLDLLMSRSVPYIDVDAIQAGTLMGGGNAIYLNDGGAFTLAPDALDPALVPAATFEGKLLDADDDGDLDVYLINDFGMWLVPNGLALNDGAGHFTAAADCGCELAQFGMGAALDDLNGDGWADLYVTDLGGPNLLLASGAARFYDATLANGADLPATEDRLASWGAAAPDVNLDGWPDLAVMFGQLLLTGDPNDQEDLAAYAGDLGETWVDSPAQRDALLLNLGEGRFSDVSTAAGFDATGVGRSVAVGDLDRDGRPEMVTAGIPYLTVWRNTSQCAPGLSLRLEQEGPNPEAIGARIDAVLADGRTLTRWMLPGGVFSTSAAEIVLGLGRAGHVDGLTVTWPDGAVTTHDGGAAGETLVLRR